MSRSRTERKRYNRNLNKLLNVGSLRRSRPAYNYTRTQRRSVAGYGNRGSRKASERKARLSFRSPY